MHINAGRLYRNAVTMVQSIERGNTAPGEVNALTSIIFATLSLETFINEISFLADWSVEADIGNALKLRMFSDVMTELEKGKASINAKYLAGKFMISGQPFDKGKAPFQDFKNLIKLRNEIIHQKSFEEIKTDSAGNVTVEKRELEPFRSKGLLGEIQYADVLGFDAKTIVTNWLDDISTKAMAIWACNTASHMVNAFLDGVPDGIFRVRVESAYRESFRAI